MPIREIGVTTSYKFYMQNFEAMALVLSCIGAVLDRMLLVDASHLIPSGCDVGEAP